MAMRLERAAARAIDGMFAGERRIAGQHEPQSLLAEPGPLTGSPPSLRASPNGL
jgi:hypothetical protein